MTKKEVELIQQLINANIKLEFRLLNHEDSYQIERNIDDIKRELEK